MSAIIEDHNCAHMICIVTFESVLCQQLFVLTSEAQAMYVCMEQITYAFRLSSKTLNLLMHFKKVLALCMYIVFHKK